MKVLFSSLASFKLQKLAIYIEQKWGLASKNKFIESLDVSLIAISNYPESFPNSKIDNKIRKCVVTKQTSIYYEIHSNQVIVLTIIDNRQNPKEILKEIKKHFK